MRQYQNLLIALLICLVPIVYLTYEWSSLPQSVPLHFGVDGKPDDYGSKGELILALSVMTAIGIGTFLLLMNIHKIDPKKPRNSPALMAKISFGVLILLAAIQCMIVNSAVTGTIKFDRLLLPLISLFFAFIGNVLYSVKPNYFVGIRTPWALENEDNWRRTHQLAGKLWFAGGIVAAVVTLLVNFQLALFIFMAIAFTITIIPFVYSYRIYRSQQPGRS